MSFFSKAKQCTGSLPCRFRFVLLAAVILVVVSVLAVPYFAQ